MSGSGRGKSSQQGILEPPVATELVSLVAGFLEQEVYPIQDDQKVRLRVRVASNLLRLVACELQAAGALVVDVDGYAITNTMLQQTGSLCSLVAKLRAGELSLVDSETYELVRSHVEEKLRIVAPEALQDRRPS